MSEYIEIETEISDDGRTMYIYTNLALAEGSSESYHSTTAMEEGSPVAQALAVVEGVAELMINDRNLTITRQPEADWHVIVADISAALKDFFL